MAICFTSVAIYNSIIACMRGAAWSPAYQAYHKLGLLQHLAPAREGTEVHACLQSGLIHHVHS